MKEMIPRKKRSKLLTIGVCIFALGISVLIHVTTSKSNFKKNDLNNNGEISTMATSPYSKATFNREKYILTTCGSKANGSCRKSETMTVLDGSRNKITGYSGITLQSSNTKVVTVSGVNITATGAGSATIYAKYNGNTIGQATVKVYAGGVALYDNPTSQDYIVYEANVLEFGADPYGDSDSTNSIITALETVHGGSASNCELANAKGGTVFVPAGLYQVTKAITVSCNEGLMGELKKGTAEGTVMLMMNASATFYVNMNSAIKNMAFYLPYMNSNYGSQATIRNGGSGNADVNIENIYFVNSNIGMYFPGNANHTGPSAILIFRDIYGSPNTGIINDNNLDTIRLENVYFNKNYYASGVKSINAIYKSGHSSIASKFTTNNAVSNNIGIELRRVDWYYLSNVEAYNYGKAIHLTSSSQGNTEGSCFDCRGSNFVVSSARHGIMTYGYFTNYQNNDSTGAGQVSIAYSYITNNLTVSSNKIPASATNVKVGNYNVQYPPRIMYNTSASVSNYTDSTITSNYNTAKIVKTVKAKTTKLDIANISNLQSKLNSMSSAGGGVVYLPSGTYTLTSTINIPSNVELRGATPWLHDVNFNGVTRIIADGRNAFTMQSNSIINGIVIQYNSDEGHNGIIGKGANISVINTDIHAAGLGIDFSSTRCDNHYVDKLFGVFIWGGVQVGSNSQNGIIRDSHFHTNQIGGTGTAKGMRSWQNEIAFIIGASNGEKLFNNFVWGSNVGMKFENATNFFALQNGVDMANTYSVQLAGSSSGRLVNNMLVSNGGHCPHSRYVYSTATGSISYVNNMFWGNEQCDTIFDMHGGNHTFYGGIINEHNTNKVKEVFASNANSLSIYGVIINEKTSKIISKKAGTATIQGSLCSSYICTNGNIQ